jgi:hypothetical protein
MPEMAEWKPSEAYVFDRRSVRYGVSGRDFDKIVLIDPVAVSPWGSPFFQHVNAHETAFAGVPDDIHESIVRAYVKTAAFKPIDNATLNMIVLPWTGRDGKAAFYRSSE